MQAEPWFDNAEALQEHVLRWQERSAGKILLYHDPGYPAWLRQISRPPVALFLEGDASVLETPGIAIVGSRSANQPACRFTRDLAADLSQMGVVIVSGLARGIDAAAHRGACDAHGQTVAVLGNGTDVYYPPEHQQLQENIRRAGCLISELPPGSAPRAWHFPNRNRILAGLVRGVVVVQAEQRSGALITARHALEENREVMAVPGDVEDVRNRGAHSLLRQGATLIETAADVLSATGWDLAPRSQGEAIDRYALLALLREPRTPEVLRARLGWKSEVLQACLAELEVLGWVGRDGRGRFRRLRSPAS